MASDLPVFNINQDASFDLKRAVFGVSYAEKKDLLVAKVGNQLSLINSNSDFSNNYSLWRSELENITLYRIEAVILRVANAVIKFFSKERSTLDDLLECNSLAAKLITNYSQLLDPSSMEYPEFQSETDGLLKLFQCRHATIQKLLTEFKQSLLNAPPFESKRLYQELPGWLQDSIQELIASKECAPDDFKVLTQKEDEFPCLMDQLLEVFNSQLSSYTELLKCSDAEQRGGVLKGISSNDGVINLLINQKVTHDRDAIYDAGIGRVLKKVPGAAAGEPIHVTMVSAEYSGLLKEGGLAEAVEGMSRGILALNPLNKVSLVFPKYSHLPKNVLERMQNPVAHVDQQGNSYLVYTQTINGVCCYFIEDPLFELNPKKPKIYDKKQHQRFAAFTAKAADFIHENKNTDVIHLHDWHVSGVALKLKNDYPAEWESGKIPPVVFTFHNNNQAAQGILPSGPYSYDPVNDAFIRRGILDHNGNLFVKAIEAVDQVTTVSKSFAMESQKIEKGHGVSFAVKEAAKVGKLVGIINGSNPSRFDPATDRSLMNWKGKNLCYGPDHYDILGQKDKCKAELKKWIEAYFPKVQFDTSKPIVTYIGRFDTSQKGMDKLEECIQETLRNGGQFLCMGSLEDKKSTILLNRLEKKYRNGALFIRDFKGSDGKFYYQEGGKFQAPPKKKFFWEKERKFPHPEADENRLGVGSLVRAASDFIFIPSRYEPCGLVQFEGWLFGSLAIASNTGGLADTISSFSGNQNTFNGFLFDRDKSGELSQAISQALKLWKNLEKRDKETLLRRLINESKKYDWNSPTLGDKISPAQQYRIVYENAKARSHLRNVKGSFHLIESLRARYLASATGCTTSEYKVNVKYEAYLESFYSKHQDRQRLNSLYQAIPVSNRASVPHPYGIDVNYQKYEEFGAFLNPSGVKFSSSSTAASSVSVVLLNDAMEVTREVPLVRKGTEKWEAFLPNVKAGQKYQYKIDGKIKMDPYGRSHSFHSNKDIRASVVVANQHQWTDNKWTVNRTRNAGIPAPMSIYEMHLGSWKKDTDGKPLNYRKLAHELSAHCQKVGYTHIELMGLLEHAHEGSWGYQACGYFSPNSRHGSADDFKYLVNHLHNQNIGVILDWVPAHYEQNDQVLDDSFKASGIRYWLSIRNWFSNYGYHFDYSQKEVREFLISSAHYWLSEMHLDGIRGDCLTGVLYSEDKESAHLFLRDFNAVVHDKCRGALTIAEDYSGDHRITFPYFNDGFGFDMKWNFSWMYQTLGYFISPLQSRKGNYDKIQNAIMSDLMHKQVLCISHDEVKGENVKTLQEKAAMSNDRIGTLMNKFSHIKDRAQRNANMRAFLSFMMCSPGKKLNFAGNDWGNEKTWNHFIGKQVGVQDGMDLTHENQRHLLAMMTELQQLYKSQKALHERDANGHDIEWIEDPNKQVHAYRRQSECKESLACFHNLTDQPVKGFVVSIPKHEKNKIAPKEIFSSDALKFGGAGSSNPYISIQETEEAVQYTLNIPPLATVIVSEGVVRLKKPPVVEDGYLVSFFKWLFSVE